jgi:dodecin
LAANPKDRVMPGHICKVVELVGSSERGIDDAIQTAITRAGATLRHRRWFEVTQIGGVVGDAGTVDHTQVTLKAGFTLEDE